MNTNNHTILYITSALRTAPCARGNFCETIVTLTTAAKLLKHVKPEYMLLHAIGLLDTSDQLLHKLALLLCKLHCKLHTLVNEMFY